VGQKRTQKAKNGRMSVGFSWVIVPTKKPWKQMKIGVSQRVGRTLRGPSPQKKWTHKRGPMPTHKGMEKKFNRFIF